MPKAASLAATGADAGVILMMAAPTTIEALRAEVQQLRDAGQEILAAADSENRRLNEDERTTLSEGRKKISELEGEIELREGLAPPVPGANRRTVPDGQVAPLLTNQSSRPPLVPATPRRDDPRGGFTSFGTYAQAVRAANNPDARDTEAFKKLVAVATTYSSEGVGADGGWAVPTEFRKEIWQKVLSQENLLGRCTPLVTGTNSMTLPKDETTPWQTSGGVQVYWESEAAQATNSKVALEMAQMRLNKLMALVPISDELLEDAPGIESWLRAKAPAKMAAKINTAIVRGTGAGQPLGILNAGCLVTVTAGAGQAAGTVWFENINKMWSRLYAPCRRNAVWLINQDCEPQLDAMAFDPAASSKVPVYIGPNGVAGSPYATLKGRPVVPIEACSTVGTTGDIILADLTEYWALTKGQDVKSDVSMHLYFDQGLTAFRFTFRVNGQPSWGSTITPENGSNTRSCFTTIATRM